MIQGYWGISQILERLGYPKAYHDTFCRLLHQGLPAYRRRKGPRVVWYTDEALLQAWQLVQVRRARVPTSGKYGYVTSPPLPHG